MLEEDVKELFSYLKAEKEELFLQKIALLFTNYSSNSSIIKMAQENLPQAIEIDTDEMESLVNPEKFDFPEPDIGLIGTEDE